MVEYYDNVGFFCKKLILIENRLPKSDEFLADFLLFRQTKLSSCRTSTNNCFETSKNHCATK